MENEKSKVAVQDVDRAGQVVLRCVKLGIKDLDDFSVGMVLGEVFEDVGGMFSQRKLLVIEVFIDPSFHFADRLYAQNQRTDKKDEDDAENDIQTCLSVKKCEILLQARLPIP